MAERPCETIDPFPLSWMLPVSSCNFSRRKQVSDDDGDATYGDTDEYKIL